MRSPEEYQQTQEWEPKPRVWGYTCLKHRILRLFGFFIYEFEAELPSEKIIHLNGYDIDIVKEYASDTLLKIGYHHYQTAKIIQKDTITNHITGMYKFNLDKKEWYFEDYTPILYAKKTTK